MSPNPNNDMNAVTTTSFMPPGGPDRGSISLAMLIDFIVQRTYHDLTVLAEL